LRRAALVNVLTAAGITARIRWLAKMNCGYRERKSSGVDPTRCVRRKYVLVGLPRECGAHALPCVFGKLGEELGYTSGPKSKITMNSPSLSLP